MQNHNVIVDRAMTTGNTFGARGRSGGPHDIVGAAVCSKRWDVVRRWRGLSASAKFAWFYLWKQAGFCTTFDGVRFTVTAADVGNDQGTCETSGHRSIAAMKKVGFIDVMSRQGGVYEGFMQDPLIVAIGRRVSAADAGQAELFVDEQPGDELEQQPEESEVVAGGLALRLPDPSPPADPQRIRSGSAAPNTNTRHLARARIETPNTLNTLSCVGANASATDPLRNGSDAAGPDRLAVDDAIRKVLSRLPTPEEQEQRISQYAAWLKGKVADPKTHDETFRRIAAAVYVEGVPRSKVDAALKSLEKRRAQGDLRSPGAYFMVAIKEEFRTVRFEWRDQA